MQLEICVDSVESAIAAEHGGADRVELCSDLLEGGITPSAGLIATVRHIIGIGIFVMIRPRGGDFCYSEMEFAAMQEDIRQARELGADGLVLGVLTEDATVDVARTAALVRVAEPLPVTFHRAIDMTPDPVGSVQAVIEAGARRILTSGGAAKVTEALDTIARMVSAAGDRLALMAASGINPDTVAAVAATGISEFHAALRTGHPSPVRYRKQGVTMGAIPDHEYLRFAVQEERVRALRESLDAAARDRDPATSPRAQES
ncbi:MAG TPA: copper homeostasis protein CutC [Acidobacteriaceae bacterium]|jgi:copper homeostasis protein|nr:copper homeostasis protein CutC [Acidobacteriaceae bacterium]